MPRSRSQQKLVELGSDLVRPLQRGEVTRAGELARGGYVLWDSPGSATPELILISTGAEVAPTLAAAIAISGVGAIICPLTPGLGKADREILEARLGHVALIGSTEAAGQALPELSGLRLSPRKSSATSTPGMPCVGPVQPRRPAVRNSIGR